MRKTNKLLAAALAILLAFSTMSLSLTAFAQGDSLADRIAAYSGDLSDEAGSACRRLQIGQRCGKGCRGRRKCIKDVSAGKSACAGDGWMVSQLPG